MSVQILLNIPQTTYRKVTQIATDQNSNIEQLLLDAIQERYEPFPLDEQHAAMQLEVGAYHRLHPMLVQKHLGDYVAIYQGELVDFSADLNKLADRIDETFPDQVVLVRQVRNDPERTLQARSPRLSIRS